MPHSKIGRQLAEEIAEWPLDQEQRALISSACARLSDQEAEASLRSLQRARQGVLACAQELARTSSVEETVRLRDERVHVERRQVDRPAFEDAEDAFRERTIEVSETDEEAVVEKEARVVEEVEVSKDAVERGETVRDTVRRTEVEVEDITTGQRTGGPRRDRT